MTTLRKEHIQYASARWKDGLTMQEIADELADIYDVWVHKQAIQKYALADRTLFPHRTREQKSAAISRGIRHNASREGNGRKFKNGPTA